LWSKLADERRRVSSEAREVDRPVLRNGRPAISAIGPLGRSDMNFVIFGAAGAAASHARARTRVR